MIHNHLPKLLAAAVLLCCSISSIAQNKYQAPKAVTAPVIDGAGNDVCWSSAPWYTVDQLWLGVQPSPADFTERFKVSWDANKLYVLGEVTDDVLNDNYADPLSNYWEDDTWEVFIDENNSGGDHEKSYNAFAYHISKSLDAVDIGSNGSPVLLNSHVNVKRTATGNVYIWEAAFDVYTDAYVHGAASNPKATLTAGKIMGFALAYCDNDGGTTRQSFIGSEFVAGTDKNQAYKNASVFGDLELVDAITPTFSHVAVASGLTAPTSMAFAPDGRIFVCEQGGNLRVIHNGSLQSAAVLSLTVNKGTLEWSERGLIGITLDPEFATNNYIYLFYTTSENGIHNRVSRFTLNGNSVVAGSELKLLELDGLVNEVHNGGGLAFGNDGKLYIATGENQIKEYAQNLENTHGKILRINKDGSIPSDNPFANETGKRRLIWAYGLRNPFTFDIQPGTGKIFVNNVGSQYDQTPSTASEEINDATLPGKNFGWPIVEGFSSNQNYANPVYAYLENLSSWNDTTGCAISGGAFFNPASTNYPSRYFGKYFFMDYCAKWIGVIDPTTGKRTEVFAKNIPGSGVYLKTGTDGNLYYISRATGAVYKIVYSGSPVPDILDQPDALSVPESQPAVFKVQANGAIPLSYQWKKDGQDIQGANSDTYTINLTTKADSGIYSVVVSNTYGTITSNAAKLTITAFNSRPVATITSPANNSKYSGGDTFVITGTGSDAEDGTLPESAYTWKVDFHHADHVHDGVPKSGTKTLNLTAPVSGELATDVYFAVSLIVQDKDGLKDTATINLYPNVVNMTFNTEPAGLTILIEGSPVKTPVTLPGVVKMERLLNADFTQTVNKKGWRFSRWAHGGNAQQTLITPSSNTTYTAIFEEAPITNESINPLHDAYVQVASWSTADATTTYGVTKKDTLVVKNFISDPDRETYITFDLSTLTGNVNLLKSAKVKLYGSMMAEDGPATISIDASEALSTTWEENTITWTNKPGKKPAVLSTTGVSKTTGDFYFWDITQLVKTRLSETDKKVSVVLSATTDHKNRVKFHSRENSSNQPELVVEYDVVSEVLAPVDHNEFFAVYPNPAKKAVNINLNALKSGEGLLEITDQVSSVKISEKIDISLGANSYRVNLEKLKPGMYILYIRSGNQTYSEKLVVE